jgi:hypothetical protein
MAQQARDIAPQEIRRDPQLAIRDNAHAVTADGEDPAKLQEGESSFLWNRVPMFPIQLITSAKDTEVAAWDPVSVLGLEFGGDFDVSSLDQISLQTTRWLAVRPSRAQKYTYLNLRSSRATLDGLN